jgi:cobalamin synthase
VSGLLINQITQLRAIISFFSLIPIAPRHKIEGTLWAASMKYITVVGLLFALSNLSLLFLMHYFLPGKTLLMALVLVLVNLFLSGGLQLDG